MTQIMVYLSGLMMPGFILYIIVQGVLRRQDVYEDFIDGAKSGIRTVVELVPTLIGLMVAVGILRASGFLDWLSQILQNCMRGIPMPGELIPLAIVKMFSSSAATGLLLDIYKQYGTDSKIGLIASVMLSSTETILYTMSIYFSSVGIKKTRYTLVGALFATLTGIAASVLLFLGSSVLGS